MPDDAKYTTISIWMTTAKLIRKICKLRGRSRQEQMERWAEQDAGALGLIAEPAERRQCPLCGEGLLISRQTDAVACLNPECDYVK